MKSQLLGMVGEKKVEKRGMGGWDGGKLRRKCVRDKLG